MTSFLPASILASLSNDIYDDPNTLTVAGVTFKIVTMNGVSVVVLRGSDTAQDWMRDATAIPVWHDKLGYCHSGFLLGMDSVYALVSKAVGSRIAITGHSLGGARARILAAMFTVDGVQVEQLATFGSPKPAFINLARIIQKSGMDHRSYRNRNDVVPTVPLSLSPFLDFVHTEDWIPVNAAPSQENLQALRDHSCSLYVKGCQTLESQAIAA